MDEAGVLSIDAVPDAAVLRHTWLSYTTPFYGTMAPPPTITYFITSSLVSLPLISPLSLARWF